MAAIIHYDQGDLWTPQATFTVNSSPTDPTTLVVKVKDPSGAVTTITENSPGTLTPSSSPIARVSAGVFKLTQTLNDAGYWFVRFEGAGTATGTEEHQAIVDPSEFYESAQLGTRALVGLAETKDWLQQKNINTEHDLEIASVINDISDRFHEEAGREFKVYGTNPQTRLFDVDDTDCRRRTVAIGDLATFTTVRILDADGDVVETVAAGDIVALPRNRPSWEPIRRLSFTTDVLMLRPGYVLEVAGTWGFPSVPGSLKRAVLDAIATTLDRDVEHYRTDLAPVTGQNDATVIMVGGSQRVLPLPPAAQAVAEAYRDALVA